MHIWQQHSTCVSTHQPPAAQLLLLPLLLPPLFVITLVITHAGFKKRFGIIYIDLKNNLARHPKGTAKWLSQHFFNINPVAPATLRAASVARQTPAAAAAAVPKPAAAPSTVAVSSKGKGFSLPFSFALNKGSGFGLSVKFGPQGK